MLQINNLSDAADQIITTTLSDGSTLILEFIYHPTIQRWAVTITHPTIPGGVIQGFNICQGPNILRCYRNIIPFGLCVISTTGVDPINIEDWLHAVVAIFILDASEVAEVEQQIELPIPLVNP